MARWNMARVPVKMADADDAVVEVGQQADRDPGVLHFTSKGAAIIGLPVSKKSLAPA